MSDARYFEIGMANSWVAIPRAMCPTNTSPHAAHNIGQKRIQRARMLRDGQWSRALDSHSDLSLVFARVGKGLGRDEAPSKVSDIRSSQISRQK